MPCKLQISRNVVSCTLHDKQASGDYRVTTRSRLSGDAHKSGRVTVKNSSGL